MGSVAVLLVVGVYLAFPGEPSPSADQAQAAARQWVGVGTAQTPRRDGDEWEVDIVRPNGSLVEVTIGDRLELRGTDEERGPGGSTAPDQLTGRDRERAVAAALAAVGTGRVIGVERDVSDAEIEVNVLRADRSVLEIGLRSAFRVAEVEPKAAGDE